MTKSSAASASRQIRREAALVADIGVVAGVLQRLLQRVEHLGADAHGFGEARGADRHDHEFLEVDRIVGVHAAVDDVHHRHRQHVRVRPADIAIERQAARVRPPPWPTASDTPRMALAPSRLLVRRAVEIAIKSWSMPALVGGVQAGQRVEDLAVDGVDRLLTPLPPIARLPPSRSSMRLVRAGRGAGGHRGAAMLAVLQHHVDLDRRVAAAVENFAADDVDDGGHAKGLSKLWALLA